MKLKQSIEKYKKYRSDEDKQNDKIKFASCVISIISIIISMIAIFLK